MKQLIVWDDFKSQAEKLKTTAETLTVTDVSQVAEMKLARATRLTIKNLRVAITHKHRELKESVLEESRKIDAGKNELLRILEPLEERLLLQETFAERETERIRIEVRQSRTTELGPYLSAPVIIDLADLTDAEYSGLLKDSIATHTAKLERLRLECEAAEAVRKAEADRIEAQRAENERLKKEAAEREAARKAAEIARDRLEKQLADERKSAQAKLEAEANRLKAEKLALVAKANEAVAKLEREAKAARDKLAAEQLAVRLAEEKAALAPDKEKILEFSKRLWETPRPITQTDRGGRVIANIGANLERLCAYIQNEANNL